MAKGLLARAILGGVPWGGGMVRWGWAVRERGVWYLRLRFLWLRLGGQLARRACCAGDRVSSGCVFLSCRVLFSGWVRALCLPGSLYFPGQLGQMLECSFTFWVVVGSSLIEVTYSSFVLLVAKRTCNKSL